MVDTMTTITINRLVGKACAVDSETGDVAEGALSAAFGETGVVINKNQGTSILLVCRKMSVSRRPVVLHRVHEDETSYMRHAHAGTIRDCSSIRPAVGSKSPKNSVVGPLKNNKK
jgi:hypothetical protein